MGACGNGTAESKEVARYHASPRMKYDLWCGNANYELT